MTPARRSVGPVLRVVGWDEQGRQVLAFTLEHGGDPVAVLRSRGWRALVQTGVSTVPDPHEVTLHYLVSEAPVEPGGGPSPTPAPRDSGLVVEAGEQADPRQRAAAYGVVTSSRGVLLTQLSEQTNAPGWWNLPGGGIDPGESPQEAVRREVGEESGQLVQDLRLLETLTSHWVGRSPAGRLEDFHAVRVVFAASCPVPTDPVVHDVDGSTSAAAWVPVARLEDYRLASFVRENLRRWLA